MGAMSAIEGGYAMSDIRTVIIPTEPGRLPVYDFSISAPGLESDDGLESAIIISLFTDRRADEDDPLPEPNADRRGWWGDAYPEIDQDKIGSKLWLLSREKQLQSVVNRAREYAREALAWLVEDGIVSRVQVEAEIVRQGVLGLGVTITRPAQAVQKYRFDLFWQGA
jgi:phage gp46-like protein